MQSKEAKSILISQHGKICFLGGEISKQNPLTLHHIKPVRDGGLTTLDNTALLARLEHDMFNIIERYHPKHARDLNEYFRYFKLFHDLQALYCARREVLEQMAMLGYGTEERGKKLVLRRF